jgi:hypothetical protein
MNNIKKKHIKTTKNTYGKKRKTKKKEIKIE